MWLMVLQIVHYMQDQFIFVFIQFTYYLNPLYTIHIRAPFPNSLVKIPFSYRMRMKCKELESDSNSISKVSFLTFFLLHRIALTKFSLQVLKKSRKNWKYPHTIKKNITIKHAFTPNISVLLSAFLLCRQIKTDSGVFFFIFKPLTALISTVMCIDLNTYVTK